MAHARGQQIARQAADAAGDGHGADDDAADVDTGVMRGVFALAHHGDLIALLGELHIDIQAHHKRQHNEDGQEIAVGADGRQPALLALAVDEAHVVGAAGVFPEHDGEGDKLHGDVVEHEGKERLVGVPSRLEKRGNHAPDEPGGYAREGA